MKKSLAVVAIVSLLIGIICGGSMFGMAADRIFGDIDGDGKITAGDARLILRHVANIETLKEPAQSKYPTPGTVIYNENDIKITYQLLIEKKNSSGYTLYFLIENNRNDSFYASIKALTVNNKYVVKSYFGPFVSSKDKVLNSLSISNSELADFDINKIDTISFKFKFTTYTKTIATSNEITIKLP